MCKILSITLMLHGIILNAQSYDGQYVTHTFNEDGSYIVRTYDLLMNQEDFITYEYSIQGKVITVSPSEAEDAAPVSYDITKLNKREMSWKMVGATENSYGYDIIHFVRDE